MCSSVVERCPDKTEVVGPIPTTRTRSVFVSVQMEKNNLKIPWWRDSLLFFSRISGWIAGPILFSLFFGKWLDKKFNSEPWIFLGMTAIAFAVSLFGLLKESKTYIQSIVKQKEVLENGNTTYTTDK